MASTKSRILIFRFFIPLNFLPFIGLIACSPTSAIPYATYGPIEVNNEEDVELRIWVKNNNYKEVFKFASLKWNQPSADVSEKYIFYKPLEIEQLPDNWIIKDKFKSTYAIIFYAREESTNFTDTFRIVIAVLP